MTPAEAQTVLTAFDIFPVAQANAEQIARIDSRTAAYAVANSAALGRVVNRAMAKLRELLSFLDRSKPFFARGDALIAINDVFGLTLRTLPEVSPLVTDGRLGNKCVQLGKLSGADKTVLRDYYGDVAAALALQAPAERVVRIVWLFIGRDTASVLAVLKAVHDSHGNVTKVTEASIDGLIRVQKAFPHGVFTGFTQWGPGDGGAADVNYRNHFLKHVCDSTGQFGAEAAWWWNALQITVRVEDLSNPAPSLNEAAFFAADGSLDRKRLGEFIANVVSARPGLRQALFATYAQAYSDYAFRLSRQLSAAMVESDGTERVLISGFTGHVALFGRFDGPAGAMGLSSCYFVVPAQRAAKLTTQKETRIWELR